ncbi:MAG: flagellar hook-associated protein FlgL [Oligoflexus sp.]
MRVSDRQRYHVTGTRVEHAKTQNSDVLEQVSTQKRINHVSDDPVAFGQSLKRQTAINDMGQYQKNIEFSKGYIERAEASLMGIGDFLIRAKELSVSLSNSTYDVSSRKAAAREVKELIEGIVGLANAQYGGRYVFSGFRTKTPPLSRDGNFLGDDGAIFLQIDHGTFRQINLQARNLFEPNVVEREQGRFGMIHALDVLQDSLNKDDLDGIRKVMDELDHLIDKTSSYQATLGAIYNGVENTARRIELSKEVTVKELSNLEDVDTYKSASEFKRTEGVLQSTMLASNKLLQPSLLNFLQ